jgi:uncharacterized membrane protein
MPSNPPAKPGDSIVAHTEVLYTHSGPLPEPSQLAQYENISPGAADRIISMAEKQSSHRQFIEKTLILSNSRNSTLGVISAFVLGMVTIVGGIVLAFHGRELSGAIIGSAGLIGLASVFIYGTRSSRAERMEKSKPRNRE